MEEEVLRTRDFGNPLRRQFLASHSDYLHCHISTSKGQIGSHRHLRSCRRPIHQGRTLKQHGTTKVEVFVEKRVRGRAQTAGANSRRGATKKREISRTLFGAPPFFHKSTLLSTYGIQELHAPGCPF